MRSLVLSLVLGLGALGLTLATPTHVRADEFRGPAFMRGYAPVAYYWRGGTHWRGRSHYVYPRYGYGFNRGYYPYGGYGAYGLSGGYGGYYPRFYGGGGYPWGGGYGIGPYYNNYYGPRFWR
jgi:hypothetical protein